MDKKAQSGFGNLMMANIMHIIFAVVFFAGLFLYIGNYQDGAIFWEDYYSKEIVKVIDISKTGDEIWIDVHKATEIAQKNKVPSFSNIFTIDNVKNDLCVQLNRGRKNCYSFFNDVDVVHDLKLVYGKNIEGTSVNVLYLRILEKKYDGGSNDANIPK